MSLYETPFYLISQKTARTKIRKRFHTSPPHCDPFIYPIPTNFFERISRFVPIFYPMDRETNKNKDKKRKEINKINKINLSPCLVNEQPPWKLVKSCKGRVYTCKEMLYDACSYYRYSWHNATRFIINRKLAELRASPASPHRRIKRTQLILGWYVNTRVEVSTPRARFTFVNLVAIYSLLD